MMIYSVGFSLADFDLILISIWFSLIFSCEHTDGILRKRN